MSAHVFVGDLDRPELSDADRHHLDRVLRLRTGEEITVSDGVGGWRRCRFGPALEPLTDIVRDPQPSPPIAVGFALIKGERPEWTVQKLTELGVDRIVPFVAARSVVRWSGERAAGHVERLRRVAREAAMQSRRTWLPCIDDVATFAELAARPGATLTSGDGGPPALAPLVLVGPEGGWADEELSSGLPRMRLGPHVLRAETAAITVGALLAALRAGLARPAESERGDCPPEE